MIEPVEITDAAQPVIERAPTVDLVLLINGYEENITLKPGEWSEIFGYKDAEVQVLLKTVNRPKPVPVTGPPYRFLIQCTDGYERVIRSMDESNAVRHFHRTENQSREIQTIFPITHLTS